jgi:hypothetical protein
MPEEPPVVVMDETGHSGENLLDAEQPVFALAAVHISEADAQRVADAALGRTQADELKFSGLRRSGAGRDTILQILSDAALTPETAFVAAAHKPWMLAAKLIDELVEPRMTARGLSIPWYASGAPAQMADDLHRLGPTELGELDDELGRAFVPLVRDYTSEDATRLLEALHRCREAVGGHEPLSLILGTMLDTDTGLAEEFSEREGALDPAIPLVWFQGCYWTVHLGEPFVFVHDDSKTVERWKDDLVIAQRSADSSETLAEGPTSLSIGGYEMPLPTKLQSISFAESHRDARLQIADVLAGASA